MHVGKEHQPRISRIHAEVNVPVSPGRLAPCERVQKRRQREQQHKPQQQAEQTMQARKRGQREEGEKGQVERERGERGKKEKGMEAGEERDKEVKKDVTGWTVVTGNKREKRRTIQIFIKVNESRTFPLDVSQDDKVDDVLRQIQSEEGGVTDGCMVQVTSRMRGGGKHKDKKSKAEKKQAASGKTLEQKFVEEVRSDKVPAIRECDEDATVTRQEPMSDVSQETQKRDEDNMIHLLDEDSMKSWVEFWSKERDNGVGQRIENWMSVLLGVKEVDVERANIWKCGMRWAVEARRKERGGEQNTGQEQGKQGKHSRFGQDEQQEETKAENTDEPEVTSRLADTITRRGMTGLVREGDERCQANEISRKGKGKGNGGKGEHEGKGGGVSRSRN